MTGQYFLVKKDVALFVNIDRRRSKDESVDLGG